uniref:hypothetical protein n=1 Tax=Thiolapillus sp. TaxID=2017437 RepID=UPI003AF45E3D
PKPEPTPKQLARLIQERHRRRQAATESCRRRGGEYDKVELIARYGSIVILTQIIVKIITYDNIDYQKK